MRIGTRVLERIRHVIELEGIGPTWQQPLLVALRRERARVEVELYMYDSLGIALHMLTVWGNAGNPPLHTLVDGIAGKVTYLTEPLAPIEKDLDREIVYMRSAPPLVDADDGRIEYYEGLLTREHSTARFRLMRYRRQRDQRRRVEIPVTLTHDVFCRLVDDLATILTACDET